MLLPKPGRRTLKMLLDIHIRSIVADNLSTAQHTYIKARSTETALHEVINVTEKSLHLKPYTITAFLDVEGTSNNIELSMNIESLQHGGIGERSRGRDLYQTELENGVADVVPCEV